MVFPTSLINDCWHEVIVRPEWSFWSEFSLPSALAYQESGCYLLQVIQVVSRLTRSGCSHHRHAVWVIPFQGNHDPSLHPQVACEAGGGCWGSKAVHEIRSSGRNYWGEWLNHMCFCILLTAIRRVGAAQHHPVCLFLYLLHLGLPYNTHDLLNLLCSVVTVPWRYFQPSFSNLAQLRN